MSPSLVTSLRMGESGQKPVETLYRPLFYWSLPFTFLYFSLPIFSKELGASAVAIGGLFSAFTATTLVLRPLVGLALDRYGRKQFFLGALGIYAIAMLAFAFSDSLGGLYLARIIQGAGSALLWSSLNTIVADMTGASERGRALGRVDEVTARGGLIGVFAGIAALSLLPGNGWRVAFLAFAGLTLYGLWLAWRNVPPTQPAPQAVPEAAPQRSRQFFLLLVIVFLTGLSEALLAPIYLTYLQDRYTTDPFTLGWAFFPAGLVMAFLAARLGAFSDRFGRAPMLAMGMAGAGLVSLVLPWLPGLVWLAAGYTLNAAFWALSEPAETALVADLSGAQQYGRAYGVYDFASNLGFTAGPLLGGLIYDLLNPEMPFYINGIILIVSAAWVLLLLRSEKV